MLRAEHISVAYGAHRALDNVSVRVEPGEICVILGANGAGKSSLLKTIAGIVHAAPGGTITIDDEDLTGKPTNEIVEHGVALVPEGRGIFGDLSVAENLRLGAYGRQARDGQAAKLKQVLELFPVLAERRRQIARTMSGGEQQMVAIGRGLMSNPTILMLDEPSLGLSPLLCSELFKSLTAIGETGVGILLVEQNARLSLAIADRAYLLENGRITGEGRAATLANDPAVQKAYLGGAASNVHRRFGEEEMARPLAAPAPVMSAIGPADLAERATRIQRAHVEGLRSGVNGARLNGHATPMPIANTAEPIIVSNQADDLTRDAAELAKRASDILAAHIAAKRQTALEAAATLSPSSGKKHKAGKKSRDKKSKKHKR